LQHLTYGDVADQLDEKIVTLKITGELDHKLRSRDVPFYYTFIGGEGRKALAEYCRLRHKNSVANTPLFSTKGNMSISQSYILKIVKMCAKRSGFDPKTVWTHCIRKSFRKIVRQADIDDDDKEQLMGHVIRGSREAYYDKKDVLLIRRAYEQCNFSRGIPESEREHIEKMVEKRVEERIKEMNFISKEDMETVKKLLDIMRGGKIKVESLKSEVG